MDREQYNKCMKPWMTGTGKTKEERKMSFCLGAKLCSGKSKTEEEARQMCSLPKEPKQPIKKQSTTLPPQTPIPTSTLPKQKVDPSQCNPSVFLEAASQYKALYALIHSNSCTPCDELRQKVRTADIKIPIVEVPAEECLALIDELDVEIFPSVVHLKRGKPKSILTGHPDSIIKKMMVSK